jgi:hypothetical protein
MLSTMVGHLNPLTNMLGIQSSKSVDKLTSEQANNILKLYKASKAVTMCGRIKSPYVPVIQSCNNIFFFVIVIFSVMRWRYRPLCMLALPFDSLSF